MRRLYPAPPPAPFDQALLDCVLFLAMAYALALVVVFLARRDRRRRSLRHERARPYLPRTDLPVRDLR